MSPIKDVTQNLHNEPGLMSIVIDAGSHMGHSDGIRTQEGKRWHAKGSICIRMILLYFCLW